MTTEDRESGSHDRPLRSMAHLARSQPSGLAQWWAGRSVRARGLLIAGVGSGALALAHGAAIAPGGALLQAILLPALLGTLAGVRAQSIVAELRGSPTGRLDGSEWTRPTFSGVVFLLLIVSQLLPRMRPGAGYAMLGGALIAVTVVLFHGLRASSPSVRR